ncbi:MAG: alpha/beta hydrolase-fold protein, partial [Pseudomonadota bacterium]
MVMSRMKQGRLSIKSAALAALFGLIHASTTLGNGPAPHALRAIAHDVVEAKSNGVSYDIMAWTPLGYDDKSEEAYPLLILLDGAMSMGMAVDIVSTQNVTGEARPVIVAGVSTAAPGSHSIQRTIDYSAEVPSLAVPPGAEYSFWEFFRQSYARIGMKFEEGFGGTDAFYSFLVNQLLPELQATYRVDPAEIGLAGFSSGGDFAADTLLRKDTPFSHFIIGSFGADVLAATLDERERAFARIKAPHHIEVFCGYGGDELADPNLRYYIQSGLDLMARLQTADQEGL